MQSNSEESKMRVLIADDDPDILDLFTVLLNRDNLEIDTAKDGQLALDAIDRSVAENRPYDLLITDLMMPNLDGMELIALLQERGIQPEVLAITGGGEEKFSQQLLAAGITNVLYKPFEFPALNAEVNLILDRLSNSLAVPVN
jgi:DNA-binding response OmpR family regulator